MGVGFDGAKLRALRMEKGVRQNRLAGMAGISKSYLCDMERGRASPTIETLARIAEALGERDINVFLR